MSVEAFKEANKRLDDLVAEISAAMETDGVDPGVVTDYVLVYAAQRFEDNGDTSTAVGYAYPSGGQPPHRSLGLVLHYVKGLERRIARAEDDDE